MTAVGSGVVAGFASWHEHQAEGLKALARRPRLVAHAAVESYSVLTRLPPPHRALPGLVHDFLAAFTAVEHDATLLSLDRRAVATYETVGATAELLGA